MIIYKSKLSKGHKDALSNILSQHNILLFENVFNQKEEQTRLDKALEECAYDISELIKSQVLAKPFSEALPLVLSGLSKGLDNGPFGKNPDFTIQIKSKTPTPDGGIRFTVKTETRKGQPTFIDKLMESEKTLIPFTIQAPELKELIIEGKSIFPKDSDRKLNAQLTIKPEAPIKQARITIPKTNIAFDNMMFKRIKTEGTRHHISTEDRNLPFVFNFILDREIKKGGFNFEFDSSKANVKQALQFEEFIDALNKHKRINLINPENNEVIVEMYTHEELERNKEWHNIFSKLSYIQEKTNHTIPCPQGITAEELANIYALIRVINTGKDYEKINNLSMKTNKEGAKSLIEIFKREGKFSKIVLTYSETYCRVCNQDIPFGPSKREVPDMRFDIQVEKIEEIVSNTPEEGTIELILKPIADDRCMIEFQNWPLKTST